MEELRFVSQFEEVDEIVTAARVAEVLRDIEDDIARIVSERCDG